MQSPEHTTKQLSDFAATRDPRRVKFAEQILADVQQASSDRVERYISDAGLPQTLVSILQSSIYPVCKYTTLGQVRVTLI